MRLWKDGSSRIGSKSESPRRHLATALPDVDRPAEVLDRVGRPAGEALAAGRVVVEVALVGMGFDQLDGPVRRVRVPAGS